MEKISSRENSLIKEYVRLLKGKSERAAAGRFAIEGARLCTDALQSGVRIERAFLTAQALQKQGEFVDRLLGSGARIFEISEPVAAKMTDTQNPQGVFCTAIVLDKALTMDKINIYGAYVALENLQDPGNLGTVLRTAEALGLDGVLLSADCVDLYSPKVLRASMGAVFRLPFLVLTDLPALIGELGRRGMKTLAAVPDREARSVLELDLGGGVIAAIGNEGAGLTKSCEGACGVRFTIPMGGRAESLNASSAAAILMWEMYKSR